MSKVDIPIGATARTQEGPAPASSTVVRDLMRSISRNFLAANLNVEPVQERALATVERIMVAAQHLAQQYGEDAVSLTEIAAIADMPLATVYRYFSTPQAVLRLLVRLRVSQSIQLFRTRMVDGQFESMDAFVETAIKTLVVLLESEGAFLRTPLNLRRRLYRDYGEIAFDELWDLANDIADTLLRSRLITRTETTQHQIALPLVSAIAMTKMTILNPAPDVDATLFAKTVRAMLLTGFAMLAPPSASQ